MSLQRRSLGFCIPRDSLPAESHQRSLGSIRGPQRAELSTGSHLCPVPFCAIQRALPRAHRVLHRTPASAGIFFQHRTCTVGSFSRNEYRDPNARH